MGHPALRQTVAEAAEDALGSDALHRLVGDTLYHLDDPRKLIFEAEHVRAELPFEGPSK